MKLILFDIIAPLNYAIPIFKSYELEKWTIAYAMGGVHGDIFLFTRFSPKYSGPSSYCL